MLLYSLFSTCTLYGLKTYVLHKIMMCIYSSEHVHVALWLHELLVCYK